MNHKKALISLEKIIPNKLLNQIYYKKQLLLSKLLQTKSNNLSTLNNINTKVNSNKENKNKKDAYKLQDQSELSKVPFKNQLVRNSTGYKFKENKLRSST